MSDFGRFMRDTWQALGRRSNQGVTCDCPPGQVTCTDPMIAAALGEHFRADRAEAERDRVVEALRETERLFVSLRLAVSKGAQVALEHLADRELDRIRAVLAELDGE